MKRLCRHGRCTTSLEKAFTKKHSPAVSSFSLACLLGLTTISQSSQEPTTRTSSPTTSTGIRARRAAVSAPSEVRHENLNLVSTSTGSGAGRPWTRAAARQWRHTDRTLARSARHGRRQSTVPRISAGMSAHKGGSAGASPSVVGT